MAPPGIKDIIPERPKYRGSWYPHSLSGFYIVPSLEKYHCRQIWIPSTNSVRIGKPVSLFPHKLFIPTATATNIIIAAVKYLTAALKQINKNPILPPYDTITRKALFQLDSILSNASYALKLQQSPFLNFQGFPLQNPLLHLQGCLHLLHKISTIYLLQHKNIAEIFSLPNPKLLQKHHLFFLHKPNSSPTLTISHPLLITLMLPLQL